MIGPSLSEVRAWTPDYLTVAARHWTRVAEMWDDTFERMLRDVQEPDGTTWTGPASDAAAERMGRDRVQVRAAAENLRASADAAHHAVDALADARHRVVAAVADAERTGFVVGEDYSVRSLDGALAPPIAVARKVQAALHAITIRSAVLALTSTDRDSANEIAAAARRLHALQFRPGGPSDSPAMYGFGPLDFPLPERPRGAPPPPEPAGGWSEDPITRAAQHISYGHAGTRHLGEWPPGTTREQLAAEIERIMRAATHPNSGMVVGRTPDGAPAIYDPKTNTLVIRDAHANDAGTAFKPTNPKSTLASKVATRLPNIPASELGLEPRPPGEPSRPQPPRPPSRGGMPPIFVPPQIVPLPGPGSGGLPPLNSGGLPDLDAPGQ